MDITLILTPVITMLGMVAWDVVRTWWFAKYTAKVTAERLGQKPQLVCNTKLLCEQSHNHRLVITR